MNELLLTNTLGSYFYSTKDLVHSRKYHGWLAAARVGLTRVNVLNRVEEILEIDGEQYYLSANYYGEGQLEPQGFRYLQDVSEDYCLSWTYKVNDLKVTRAIQLAREENKLLVRYHIHNPQMRKIKFKLIPLVTFRDMHELKNYSVAQLFPASWEEPQFTIIFSGDTRLVFNMPNASFQALNAVYKDIFYPKERDRGYNAHEDLQALGEFSYDTTQNIYSIEMDVSFKDIPKLLNADVNWEENANLYKYTQQSYSELYSGLPKALQPVANFVWPQTEIFLVKKPVAKIVAGFPWFGEWGRDTFISFTGLLLATKKTVFARNLLLRWSKLFQNGLLPNVAESGVYNSIDSCLWYVYALWKYWEATKDLKTIQKIMPALEQIIQSFSEGKNHISISEEGFLYDHNREYAMTWMDAQVDGKPVIKRSGHAVEIQALWFNYLKVFLEFKKILSDTTHVASARRITKQLQTNFEAKFWNNDRKCLYDVIDGDYKDSSIRPNQIVVLMLPWRLLKQRTAKTILSTLQQKLYTPFGLRTLDVEDPNYQPTYSGDQTARDQAYHNGSIWPFLGGMFLLANLRTQNFSKKAQSHTLRLLQEQFQAWKNNEFSYLPEIVDPTTFKADGCVAQAWSVALYSELLWELYKLTP